MRNENSPLRGNKQYYSAVEFEVNSFLSVYWNVLPLLIVSEILEIGRANNKVI